MVSAKIRAEIDRGELRTDELEGMHDYVGGGLSISPTRAPCSMLAAALGQRYQRLLPVHPKGHSQILSPSRLPSNHC